MMSEEQFAAELARALGPLYRVSLIDADGGIVVSFGPAQANRGARDSIRLPGSSSSLVIETDISALEGADRVLHALAAPHQLTETPLGAFAHLDDALSQLIAQAEAHVGKQLKEMSRAEKQQLVRYLDDRGAFTLRKAVEKVAETLGVSRFTVYNYLDSVRAS